MDVDLDVEDNDLGPQVGSDPAQFVGDYYGEEYGPEDFPGFDEDNNLDENADGDNGEGSELAEDEEPLSGDEDDYV